MNWVVKPPRSILLPRNELSPVVGRSPAASCGTSKPATHGSDVAQPAKDHRADRGAVLDEARAEDGEIEWIDELAGFQVAPAEERDAAADMRSNRPCPSGRNQAVAVTGVMRSFNS